jgi:hypothetical protein
MRPLTLERHKGLLFFDPLNQKGLIHGFLGRLHFGRVKVDLDDKDTPRREFFAPEDNSFESGVEFVAAGERAFGGVLKVQGLGEGCFGVL